MNQLLKHIQKLDKEWSQTVRIVDQKGVLRNASAIFAHSGDSWFMPPIFGLLWIFGNDFWSIWGKIMLLSILGVGAVVQIIKWSFRRKRPDGNWGNMVRKSDPHSFPSGHAAKAGLLMGLGLFLGPEAVRVGVCIYSPLMAFARTQMGVHYLSDVIAGFILGILSALLIITKLL